MQPRVISLLSQSDNILKGFEKFLMCAKLHRHFEKKNTKSLKLLYLEHLYVYLNQI
jgi:hypothetical protein